MPPAVDPRPANRRLGGAASAAGRRRRSARRCRSRRRCSSASPASPAASPTIERVSGGIAVGPRPRQQRRDLAAAAGVGAADRRGRRSAGRRVEEGLDGTRVGVGAVAAEQREERRLAVRRRSPARRRSRREHLRGADAGSVLAREERVAGPERGGTPRTGTGTSRSAHATKPPASAHAAVLRARVAEQVPGGQGHGGGAARTRRCRGPARRPRRRRRCAAARCGPPARRRRRAPRRRRRRRAGEPGASSRSPGEAGLDAAVARPWRRARRPAAAVVGHHAAGTAEPPRAARGCCRTIRASERRTAS